MKLKKLLPLAGMTGVAAIAAPLVTSCAQKGTTIKFNREDWGETLTPFDVGVTDVTQAEILELVLAGNYKGITQVYLKEMEKDKTIFSKEVINGVVTSTYWETYDIAYVKEMSVRTDAIDADKCTVSYHVDETIKIPLTSSTITYNIKYDAKKLPVRLVVDTEVYGDDYYHLVPYLWIAESETEYLDILMELANDKSWSYSIRQEDSDGYVIDQAVNYANVLNSTIIDDLGLLDSSVIGSTFASYYFQPQS